MAEIDGSTSSEDEKENGTDEMPEAIEMSEGEDGDDMDEQNETREGDETQTASTDETVKVYLPNQSNDDKDVPLECDESAYIFYHQAKTGAPCLSFDIIEDALGSDRADKFPLSMTIVAGTQAEKRNKNNVIVMKMSNINKTQPKSPNEDEDSESSDDDDDDLEKTPELECAMIKHKGCVNRIRVTSIAGKPIVASWSEIGGVFIWDISHPLRAVNDPHVMSSYVRNEEAPSPLYFFAGHQSEGYAMAWSPHTPGMLATGDCKRNIYLWKPTDSGSWNVNIKPFTGHNGSVEDIQWSPNEENVLASCSTDKSIRIWDIRAAPMKACMMTVKNAHDSDVNVIDWNKKEPFILSGGDDGMIKVWDLRKFPANTPICTFKHHVAPITSVEWHPTDTSVYAASGEDDQLTLWDLAVERDVDQENDEKLSPELVALPPQLLFIHQGQKEIKELHWHPQMPGVVISTSMTGFNVFRTLSI